MEMRSFGKVDGLSRKDKYSRGDFAPRRDAFVVKLVAVAMAMNSEKPKMRKLSVAGLFLVLICCAKPIGAASRVDKAPAATIAEKTAGAEKLVGYYNLYWDAKAGKLWLEIDKWVAEFLYQS